jgi:hypothetical protein
MANKKWKNITRGKRAITQGEPRKDTEYHRKGIK